MFRFDPGRLLITPRNCSGRRVAFDLRRFAAGTAAFTEVLRRRAVSPAFVLLHGKGLRRFTAVHGVGRGNGVGRGWMFRTCCDLERRPDFMKQWANSFRLPP